MSNIMKRSNLSNIMNSSNDFPTETITEIPADIKNIIGEYETDGSILGDPSMLEKIVNKISAELRLEESISTVLLAMKSSQSRSFATINRIHSNNNNININNGRYYQLPDSSTDSKNNKQKLELNNEGSKNDEFYLTPEMSRKLLDHQFVVRQKMINGQLEKALNDISFDKPLIRSQIEVGNEFIPNSVNQEFIALVGFNEVVDILKEQQTMNYEVSNYSSSIGSLCVCKHCGTDTTPSWKKRKLDQGTEDIICVSCHGKHLQSQNRKEIEDQIFKTKLQFEEQEKSLIRDYNDMLSSPKKLEMFRQEQEKRHKMQRMNTVIPTGKPNRQSNNSSQNPKTQSNKLASSVPNKPPIDIKTLCPSANLGNTKLVQVNPSQSNLPTGDSLQAQLTYLQFLQAFTLQATNSQQHIDQENFQKLEQVLSTIQSNPVLANNNMTVLQLLANLATLQDNSTNNNSNNSSSTNNNPVNAVPPTNTNLLNLVSYFVNLMQTQQNQNVVQ